MTTPAAVILAAGASARMGRCKALVAWRGRPFVAHAIALADACDRIVVVTGAVLLPAESTVGATVVHNPAWVTGPMSSLQCGLSAVPRASAVLVLTVDRPHIRADTVRALINAWSADPDCVWQPTCDGRRGHPVLYPADVALALRDAPDDATPRDILARPDIAARRRTMSTDDSAVLDNIDRPEDLARLPP